MSTKIKLTPPTGNPIEITPEDDSTRIRTRDGLTDTLTLKYSTAKPIEIPIGTTAVWRGDTYTLRRRGDLVMTHSELYRYTLRLTAPADSLPDYIVTNLIDGRIDFPLTATPEEHLQLVIDNLNRRDPGWSIGDHLTDTTPILITYSRTDCLAALRQIADTFAADLRISGKVISIAPEGEEAKGDALPLRYGQGQGMLSDIRRTAPEEGVIGTLHLVTSDRNIDPAKYGAKTLRLPESDPTGAVTISESRTAITLKGAAKGSPEAVADLSHIYPSREGTVTKAEQPGDGLWDFIDSSIPDSLDYAAATLPGESLLVIFQSGELAGREIEANYKHAERRFQLVPTETDGITLPGGSFVPHAGDRYAVFRCHLPAEYVTAAETRLLEAARRILADRSEEREVITAQIDPIWAKQHWGDVAHRLTPGRYVSFTDPRWHPAPALIRIESITDYLTDPYSPKVELSNHPATTGRITALETEIRRGEVRRAEQAQEIRALRERTWRDTETLREQIERLKLDGFTEAITPETLRTMQAVIGTPALQFDFVRSLTDTTAIPFRWSEGKGGVVTIPAQVIAKLKGGSTLSPEEQQYITTAIPELTYTLKAEERNAYIYAETDPKPRFIVTTDPLEITDTRLLVGLLNGNEGERSFTPLYGFTEITPGQIQTDLIRSKDGKSYWDLLTGEFASKSGPFVVGDPKGDTALAYIGDTLYVKGATVTLGSGDTTTIEDALLEQERKLKAEEDARAKAEDELERKHAELEEALEGLRQSTGDEQAAMAEILGKVNKTLTSLQDQVNNEVSNWFYPGSPSPDKEPESEWVTDQDKYRHIGDTYTSVDESGEYMGKSWRYTTEYKWQEIHDTLISKALSVAAKAQTTADGKSTTYYTQPAHYSVGDSWVLSADTTVGGKVYKKGTMLFAGASSDVFVGAHWGEMLKYIDSAKLDADLRASEAKSKEAWEAYAAAQASKAGEETLKAAKEYAEAQDTAYEARTKAYADKILTEKEQALIAAADAKAAAAETRAKAYADGKITAMEQLAIDKAQKAYDDAVKRAKELDIDYVEKVIDTRSLDPNKYYAVCFTFPDTHLPYTFEIYKGLYQWGGKNADWQRHEGGFSCHVRWSEKAGNWGAQLPERSVERATYAFASGGCPVSRPDQMGAYSIPYIYVRGGGVYQARTYCRTEEEKKKKAENIYLLTETKSWNDAYDYCKIISPVSKITQPQTDIVAAQQSTDKLRGYVDGAYKDGIITEVESKAIATYINEVEAMWSSAFGAYERVYVNPLLTGSPKTALADAKITLAGAKDSLISQIKSAITDGKATKEETTETERLYNAYKIALKDFQKALKEAEEAIRDAGKTTGGRNLVIRAGERKDTIIDYQSKVQPYSNNSLSVHDIPVTPGESLTFSKTTVSNTDNYWRYAYKDKDGEIVDRFARNPNQYTETVPDGASLLTVSYPTDAVVKLERGTVATDWTPAPEDVQAAIDAINANPPRISAGGTWEVYRFKDGKGAYEDTGRTAKGDSGKAPEIRDGYWYEWDGSKYTNTGIKARGEDGRGVRPNIFSYKDNPLFAQNDAYGCKIKYLGEGRYKVWKEVNGSSKGWGGASYYVPRTDNSLKTEDQVVSFRIVECSTEILSHNNNGAPYGYPQEKKYGAGDTFVYFPWERDQRIAGFAFDWDGSGALGGSKGDYVIFDQYKAEIVTGEADKRPTAYIPHPHDAKGDKGDKGEKGDGLDIIDTRKDNRPPSWYREKYSMTTVREFKSLSAIEIPSRWIYRIYCTLETVVRWVDPSGGRVEQSTTLDNGVQLRRVGTADDTAWEPWINVSAEVADIRTGLASADTAIDALKAADKAIKAGMLTTSDLPDIGWLLDAFNNGKTVTSGGLLLTKVIALSNQSNKITSYISGYDGAGKAMLAAGISDLTADPDTATSYIGYDGKAKFGSLHIEKGSLSISEMPEPTMGKVKYGRLYITPISINTWISAAERMTLSYNGGVKTKRLNIGDSSDSKIETITLRITPVSGIGIGGGNVDITGDLTVHGQIKGGEGKVRYIWDAATSVWIEPEDAHIFLWYPNKNYIYLPKADEVKEGWTVTIDWSKARGVPLKIRTQGKSAIVKSDNISTILSPEVNPSRFVITRINPAKALDGNRIDWWATEFKVW